jgi:hypothetical protein
VQLALAIAIFLLVCAGIEGIFARRRYEQEILRARRVLPVDEQTGLLNHRAYLQRVSGELKRAHRAKGNVWLGVWTVVDGDPDRFGRLAADGLHFPEVGFRLAERVFCFVRPNVDDDLRSDVHARLRRAAPRERAAVGEAIWLDGDPDAMRLLDTAIGRMEER